MSIIVNNNVSIADKEDHIIIYDRERRVSVVEEPTTFSKTISYLDDEIAEEEDDDFNFVPTVSCDNYEYVNVFGHNQM